MIPHFPNFKKLELSDQEDINTYTSAFFPYSDFNFISMWSWDVEKTKLISVLNGNLVVIFNDYITNDRFLSFIGKNEVDDTIQKLFDFSQRNYGKKILQLIPEEVVSLSKLSEYKKTLDKDSADYIYSIANLASMDQWRLGNTHKKNIKKFISKYPNYRVEHSLVSNVKKEIYLDFFKKWSDNKSLDNTFELNEFKALDRVFEFKNDSLKIVSLYVNDALVGFTMYEIVSNLYATAHFSKTDITHFGVIDFLIWQEAVELQKLGVTYYNFEQDLGIPGLRYFKESFKPESFLYKFTLEL
ncbi:MAG: phosphatidylglycerol lysyltransferase domain-containing protein [bacterium]